MVEDSLPHLKPSSVQVEEGEIQDKEIEVRVPKVVEAEEAVIEKPSQDSEPDAESPPEKLYFLFNSKPKRRKKPRKSHVRHTQKSTRPGEKRKIPCQDIFSSQGSGKRLKFAIGNTSSKKVKEVEGDKENHISISNPSISPSSIGVVPQATNTVSSDNLEDSLRARAIRKMELGNRLGLKVVKGEKNEEAYIRRAIRILKEQRRFAY